MTTPASPPSRATLAAHLAALEHGLLEREEAVRLLLLAALAREHVLLLGPPGTAKSELARRLERVFAGGHGFERLLTRFSTPEELFGPLSLKALEDDRYERLIDGYLPTASIAFLDEVFKANSAILNTLLTLFNERVFDNGTGRHPVPLVCVVGASNEAPADDALLAFHDRFLLRVPVAAVSDAGFDALLMLDERIGTRAPTAHAEPLQPAQLDALHAARDTVRLGTDALAALRALREACAELGVVVSDRRWRQFVGLLKTQAASEARASVDGLDLWLAPFVLAHEPSAQQQLAQTLCSALGFDAQALTGFGRAVDAFERQLQIEQSLPADDDADAAASDAGKLALARALSRGDATESTEPVGMMRIVAATLEERMKRCFSPVHVAARLAQLDELAAPLAQAHAAAVEQAAAAEARVAGRLWLPPALAARWCAAPRAAEQQLAAWCARLAEVRAGFAALKIDSALPGVAPAPVPTVAEA